MFKKKSVPTYEFIITGRVQGVGYRWYVRSQAQEYHISGYVKNLYTGDVQVIAQGEEEDIALFIESLYKGNGRSVVESLSKTEIKTEKTHGGFKIEH
ncbi:MAG: acylphosphatase [Candidatus Cloacimonetes bacterium]|nr:acylphosphatase [Candidatus Cloacimonadota bacterium]